MDSYKSRSCMLIIDDDFVNREIIKNIFSQQFTFLEAENGLQGLQLILENQDKLCAILTDVNMPEMDGMALVKVLYEKDILNQIPVFIITSTDELEIARDAYEMGVMGIITKPVVPFIAVRRVQLVVELFQARDSLNDKVKRQEKTLEENVQTIDALHRGTIEAMASAIEFRDVESGEHTSRLYAITKILLQETAMGEGFTEQEIENIAIGSIMHDVGKIAISDVILNKPGKLTREEFEIMKSHTLKGGELMKQLQKTQSHPSYVYAEDIARHHHERWDGRGYPDGLKGDEISIWAQVVSIADVYDALISPRVYKKAFTQDKAVEMIKNGECGCFNPKLIQCFLQAEPKIRSLYPELKGGAAAQLPQPQELSQELADYLLLTAAVQDVYDMIICVNLTRNSYYIFDYARFQTHCAQAGGVFDELIVAGASSIPESHRQSFIDLFCREHQLQAYASGVKTLTLQHPQYTDDGRLMDVSTTVLFTQDPRTGDLRQITLARYLGPHQEER